MRHCVAHTPHNPAPPGVQFNTFNQHEEEYGFTEINLKEINNWIMSIHAWWVSGVVQLFIIFFILH